MKGLIKPINTMLNRRSDEFTVGEISSDETKYLIESMYKIANCHKADSKNKSKLKLVGLAAPQLGVLKRLILVDVKSRFDGKNKNHDYRLFFNPRIISASKRTNLFKEGCFSTGNVTGIVRRSNKVIISALDENGSEVVFESRTNFVARIIQHEIDHLDGIRFPSRVTDPSKLHIVTKDDRKAYKTDWRKWQKLCPIDDWLRMYSGKK
ncbi:peptide deformylase [Candidatus Saccharibacteria bacterium]|nr:peptide deformylase [Candidatus Saccharibacteria bacterium]